MATNNKETTQIQISKKTAEELHKLKQMGESYDDVIVKLLRKK